MATLECSEGLTMDTLGGAPPLISATCAGDARRRLCALMELQQQSRAAYSMATLARAGNTLGATVWGEMAEARERRECRRAMVDYAGSFLRATNASFESYEFATITFDRYVAACLAEGVAILDNRAQAYYAMLACIFIATKIVETQPVPLAELAGVGSMILAEELNIVAKLDYLLPPLVTPSSFVRHLLFIWPEHTENMHIFDSAHRIVTVCCKERLYVKFAYSTIALAAIVYAFTRIAANCNDWLEHVPDSIVKLDQDPSSIGRQIGHGSVWECYSMIAAFFNAGMRDAADDAEEGETEVDDNSSIAAPSSPVPNSRTGGRRTPTSITELEEATADVGLCCFSSVPQWSNATRSVARRIASDMTGADAEDGGRKRVKRTENL